ncbi:MAG: enhanced serine sensitivity protein SseB [Oscillospiraceae bacterium]|nr:enhanced serine sensitivity protein SseB [Oscillospiraceae bacterium]
MQDVNVPVTNPELVHAIEALQKEINADTQDVYFKAIKNARFLSPVTIVPPLKPDDAEGKATLEVDTKISFVGFTEASGVSYLPVYTDWSALKQWRDITDEQTLITSYDDIRALIQNDPNIAGFVINPYTHNIPVRRDVMNNLDAGPATRWTAKEETEVAIGLPANDPVAMKKAIVKHLKSQKNVNGAWLVLMEKGGEFSFLIAVDFIGDITETFNGIVAVSIPNLRQGELLDMIEANSDLGRQIMRDYQPFYKRKTLGFF